MTDLMSHLRRSEIQPTGGVVVVTGASAGVGRAIALRFGRAGAAVGLVARDAAALDEVKAAVEAAGGRAAAIAADVADAAAVSEACRRFEAELGPIDIWINNAMVTVISPVAKTPAAEFRRVTEVTYLGYVNGTLAALAAMRPRNRGLIIQIGSALAYRGIPLQAAYCGAKFAIRGFTDSLRTELLHEGSGVRVTMVQLPAVNTPQFEWAGTRMPRMPRPVAPVYQPEAIADAVFRAAQAGGSEYFIGFSALKAILGSMALPRLVDRRLARSGFASQQTQAPVSPAREDNLETPVHAPHRTRGDFGAEARPRVAMWSGNGVRIAGLAGLAGAAALAGAALARSRDIARRLRQRG